MIEYNNSRLIESQLTKSPQLPGYVPPVKEEQSHIEVQKVAQPQLQSSGSKFVSALKSFAKITVKVLLITAITALVAKAILLAPYIVLAVAVAAISIALLHHFCKSRRAKQEKICHDLIDKNANNLIHKLMVTIPDEGNEKEVITLIEEGRELQSRVRTPSIKAELEVLLDTVESVVVPTPKNTPPKNTPVLTEVAPPADLQRERSISSEDERLLQDLEEAMEAEHKLKMETPRAAVSVVSQQTEEILPTNVNVQNAPESPKEEEIQPKPVEVQKTSVTEAIQVQPADSPQKAMLLKRLSRTKELRDLFLNIPSKDIEEYVKNGKIKAYLSALKEKQKSKSALLDVNLDKPLDESGQAKLRKLYLDVLKKDEPEKYNNLNADLNQVENDAAKYKMLLDLSSKCADSIQGDWTIVICMAFLKKAEIASWEPVANSPGEFRLKLARDMKGKQKLDILGDSTFTIKKEMTVRISNDANGVPTLTFPDQGFGLVCKMYDIVLDRISMAKGPNTENTAIEEDKILLGIKKKSGWMPLPLDKITKSTEKGGILINTINWNA